MLTLHTKLEHAAGIDGELMLAYDQREKCRLRARLVSGEEVAVFTPRGSVLRDGDLLTGEDGRVIRVLAAPESVYAIHCATPHILARCAYHLGNRHTQVQLGEAWLRIRVDPVFKEMVEGLGARVEQLMAAFEPEAGAYAAGGHSHGPDHLLAPVPLRQKIHRPGDSKSA
ncbi:MAG: urease accessory protein UreE [Massilia sp.]